jgi:5-hydroxyisourate hydrolase
MSRLSTHILDTSNGRPAAGVKVHLHRGDLWMSTNTTNDDGRVAALLPQGVPLETGVYRLVFEIADYSRNSFFPEIVIVFQVTDPASHYHVPLLLSPFGYSTYRGS